MSASPDLGRGAFSTSWESADAPLVIQQPEAMTTKVGDYKATLTRALRIMP